MNKKFISLLCAFIATLPGYAVVKIDGLNYEIYYSNKTASVVPDNEKLSKEQPGQDVVGDVVIPSKVACEYDNYDVTTIYGAAFAYCSEITSISIPSSVKSISGWAFCQCAGLKSVYMEDGGVTSIYINAFEGCQNLTTISIPSTITSIGQDAFKGCSNLRNVIINKQDLSTITVGKDAFAGLPKTETPNLYLPVGSGIQGKIEFGGIDFNAIPSIPSVSVTYNTAYTRTETPENNSCVIYYRDFAGIENWQALYVPFTSDYSEWKKYFIIADLVKSTESEGQDVLSWYELGGENDEHNQVLAGHPYIIKRRKNTDLPADMQSFMIFNNKSVTKSDEHHPVTITGVYGNYTLGGTYSGGTASQLANNVTGDFYALGMDGNFVKAPEGTDPTLSANRIYLVSQKKNSAQSNQAPFRMSFLEEDPGEPSSIDDCVAIEQPGDDAVYDLYGRRVTNPKSGIYIKNGRKFIIK